MKPFVKILRKLNQIVICAVKIGSVSTGILLPLTDN